MQESMIEVWNEIEKSGKISLTPTTYAHLKTKSDVIRAMSADGYTRSAIADALRIKYQFVRNVLTRELKRK